ncbi:MAG: hypothetical protein AAFX78_10135 [Cyanobacteria bacterium J06638_20]
MKPIDYSKSEPSLLLAEAMLLGASESIQRQETEGQKQLVESTVLPVRGRDGAWDLLRSFGCERGKQVDDLFCEAILPPGWRKKSTDHPMWSDLLDERGLVRGSVFYKAAFYDRDAFMDVKRDRFCVRRNYDCGRDNLQFEVFDSGLQRTIKTFAVVQFGLRNGVLGAIKNGNFYYKAIDRGYRESTFAAMNEDADATPISRDQMYKEWHHVGDGCFPEIYATDNLAQEDAIAYLATLPKDASQWLEKWDLPSAA